ncbi:dTMP kinase, partial [Roseicyclus sp.]|uniref:dTMP kinase n=1 Tax=Roseicyclus sp. TaxID=1914329 RepID=UPI003FA16067
ARWSPETEILLFTAARRDHLERTIRPALAAGRDVVTDRFADSTRVYQGATRGDLRGLVDAIHAAAIGVEPDLTLILDMDPGVALSRGLARGSGEDRFEEFGLPFQEKLRAGFLALAREAQGRCVVIDASEAPDRVAERIAEAVDARL